ncbi:MAG: hypothetical protein CMP70_00820 [Flavobacteriales bacterium]|nr:hypothetical protein [Flavobacteriales bacterium]
MIQDSNVVEKQIENQDVNNKIVPEINYNSFSPQELHQKISQLISTNDIYSVANKIEAIKAVFYKKINAEKEAHKNEFLKNEGLKKEYIYTHPIEKDFKELFIEFRKKKAEYRKKLEEDFEKNLKIKSKIIKDIQNLINEKETIKETFTKFRNLINKWRSTGEVGFSYRNDLWKSYHHQVEKFYDFIKINDDLRDLDFERNLKQKTILCKQVEDLLEEKSINKIHTELQILHEKWKEIGPVKRELREEIWERFKEATHKLNKRRNEHFLDLKQKGKHAFENKYDICKKIAALTKSDLNSHEKWNSLTAQVKELEEEWKKQAPLSKEDNKVAWKLLRETLSNFYEKKNKFYKEKKLENKQILQNKVVICEKIEELVNSEVSWKEKTEKVNKLNKDWKKSGFLPKTQSHKIWKRFRIALDNFYESKKSFFNKLDIDKANNLVKKEKILEKVQKFKLSEDKKVNLNILNDFQKEWRCLGDVPRHKTKIEDIFSKNLDNLYSKIKVDNKELNDIKFNNKLETLKAKSDVFVIDKEKQFIKNKIKNIQKEVNQYETNISFFGLSTEADKLKLQIMKKIDNKKAEIDSLKNQLKQLNTL